MNQKKLLVNITIFRGAIALVLGSLLLIQPVSVRPFALNFMGIYWLLGGIVSLRIAKEAPRAKGLRITVGVIGIVTGAALLSRSYAASLLPASTLMTLLGALILLSGVLHVLSGFRLYETLGQHWKIANVLLGVFEIVFGLMVLAFPWYRFEFMYLSVAAWSLLGGIIILGDGLRLRQLLQQQQETGGNSP